MRIPLYLDIARFLTREMGEFIVLTSSPLCGNHTHTQPSPLPHTHTHSFPLLTRPSLPHMDAHNTHSPHAHLTSLLTCTHAHLTSLLTHTHARMHTSPPSSHTHACTHTHTIYNLPLSLPHTHTLIPFIYSPLSPSLPCTHTTHTHYMHTLPSPPSHAHTHTHTHTDNELKGLTYYELYAIANHMGSESWGHYTATYKHHTTHKWYNVSDDK